MADPLAHKNSPKCVWAGVGFFDSFILSFVGGDCPLDKVDGEHPLIALIVDPKDCPGPLPTYS